jgi:predicted Zn-dependent protease
MNPANAIESGRPLGVSLTVDQMNALYFTGYQLFGMGDFMRAAAAFRLLVLCEPLHVEAWHALGACHEELDQMLVAATVYSAGFYLGGSSPLVGILAARAYIRHGDTAEALQIVEELREVGLPEELEAAFAELERAVEGRKP